MKAERQQKEATSRVIQPSKGGGGRIVDNRPGSIIQSKIIEGISKDSSSSNVLQRLPIWGFNDADAVGTDGIPPAAMRHYYSWRRQIRDNDHVPNGAGALDWDAHFEVVGDHYTIRLNQNHRVHFDCDFDNHTVNVRQIGGHDL